MMDYTKLTDKELLTLCIYGEARGETPLGKLGVAHVVLNRAAKPRWWGHDVQSVILRHQQFSCFNKSDPNAKHLEIMANSGYYDPACLQVAVLALEGYTIDPTNGADHYCVENCDVAWRDKLKEVARIGKHVFFVEA